MASTYSSLLRLELQTTGENDSTWGTVLNTQWQLVEVAIAGRAAVTHSNAADYTLTTANGAADEARRMIISVGGALTANRNVVCPTLSKLYAYRNLTTGGFATTLKTAAGTGISVPNGKYTLLLSDGTNVLDAINYLSTLSLGTPLSVADGGTGSTNAADARTALGISAGGGDTTYNFRANNLSDVANVVTARSNLGVSATGADTIYAFRANNLSDLANAGTARTNLGLGTMATQAASAVAITGGTGVFSALAATGALDLSGGSAGQILFPATQNASANANALDDYEEGTWTPTLTFSTPGDVAVAYATQVGSYVKIGQAVLLDFAILTSSYIFSTASGDQRITGVPFTSGATAGYTWTGALAWEGITKPDYTDINTGMTNGSTALFFYAQGSGKILSTVKAADTPSLATQYRYSSIAFHV